MNNWSLYSIKRVCAGKALTILGIILFGINSSKGATIVAQDFDAQTTWTYTNDIPFFDNGWAGDGYYGIINSWAPLDYAGLSNNILGENDLDDEGDNGTAGEATVSFATVNVSAYTSVTISFDWDVEGYNVASDEAEYEVYFDGVGQGRVVLVSGTNGEGTVTINVPGGTNTVALDIVISNNGASGYSGFDNFLVDGVSGSCSAPTSQDDNIIFTSVGSSSIDLTWDESGDATGSVVIMNTANSFTNPTDGTDPAANSVYGGAGEQVVFNGASNSVTVSGLDPTTTYWFRVYAYNCSGASILYNTSTSTRNPEDTTTTIAPTCVFTEDFSGGLGQWSNNGDWTTTSGEMQHDGAASNNTHYNYADIGAQDFSTSDYEWNFCMRNGSWGPSGSNNFEFYLFSDVTDLVGGGPTGYSVGINRTGTSDLITLYEINGGAYSDIIVTSYAWGSAEDICIRVTRTASGNWQLFYDAGSGETLGGSVSDASFTTGRYIGPVFEYSSTRATELWIDDISVCGNGNCSDPAPTTQASNVDTTDISTSSIAIDWTNGDGSGRIVIMNTTNSFTDPVDGVDPIADNIWSNSGEQVIYNGTGNSVSVTNLDDATEYCFRVYEYNCSGDSIKYITSTATDNPVCFTTEEINFFTEGIIINEVSNGTAGNREYYELIVAGTCGESLDIRGMIIDDNNGDFTVDFNSASGVAPGHLRLSNVANWSAVPVGAIILIYNGDPGETNPAITLADDPDDTNPFDSIYVLPHNSGAFLEITTDLPVDAGSYIYANTLYSPVTYVPSTGEAWNPLSIRNGGDAVQTRDASGTYIHGISYGTHGAPSSTLPLSGGPDDLYLGASGSGTDYSFTRDNYRDAAQWVEYDIASDASLQTPGAPNNADNADWIADIQDPAGSSCPFLVSSNHDAIDLKVDRKELNCYLSWEPSWPVLEGEFIIQKSKNGVKFESIATVEARNIQTYSYKDYCDPENFYYRIKYKHNQRKVHSNIVKTLYQDNFVKLYPNPANNYLRVWFNDEEFDEIVEISILNVVTQETRILNINLSEVSSIEIPTGEMSQGLYILQAKTNRVVIHRKFEIIH